MAHLPLAYKHTESYYCILYSTAFIVIALRFCSQHLLCSEVVTNITCLIQISFFSFSGLGQTVLPVIMTFPTTVLSDIVFQLRRLHLQLLPCKYFVYHVYQLVTTRKGDWRMSLSIRTPKQQQSAPS